MRGKDDVVLALAAFHGITPAYAGKSLHPPIHRQYSQDHPRVCGEKLEIVQLPLARRGSPPRMRGKVNELRSGVCPNGITPAYAGKSTALPSSML